MEWFLLAYSKVIDILVIQMNWMDLSFLPLALKALTSLE
jgi:hypothetical protein